MTVHIFTIKKSLVLTSSYYPLGYKTWGIYIVRSVCIRPITRKLGRAVLEKVDLYAEAQNKGCVL